MAKRLSVKNRKSRRDKASAYKADPSPKKHKVARERSKAARNWRAHRMA